MKLSIIIPCYNVENFVQKCVESILFQKDIELEIIAINDGSTDKTLEKLQKIAKDEPRLIVIDKENEGVSKARNIGLEKANGNYFMFVDGDDWLDKDCLSYLLKEIEGNDILCFSYIREYRSKSLVKDLKLSGVFSSAFFQRTLFGLLDDEIEKYESIDALVTCWGKIYKRECIANIRFRDIREIGTWEDGIFNIQVAENAKKVKILNQPYYHYRKDNEQAITTIYKKQLAEKWQIKYEWLQAYIVKYHKGESYNQALNNRIAITFLGLFLNEMNADSNFINKFGKIKNHINNEFFSDKIRKFKSQKLPLIWRIFYFCIRNKFTFLVVIGLYLISYLREKDNK